jgi:hypothetical protein
MRLVSAGASLACVAVVACSNNAGPRSTLAVDRSSVVLSVVPAPRSDSLTITSSPDRGLAWSAATDSSWVRVVPSSGVTPGTAVLIPDGSQRHGGWYEGHVTITAGGASAPVVVPVTLVVPALVGTWTGTSFDGVGVTITVTEVAGQIAGAGAFFGSGSSLPFTVSGEHKHPLVLMTLLSTGYAPASFSGQLVTEDRLTGALNGSGFVNWGLSIVHQPVAGAPPVAARTPAAARPTRRTGLLRLDLGR